MKLVQREAEKLALHNAGFLAQKRLARGLRLNCTEAVALIAAQILEFVRDGDRTVTDLMDLGKQLLGRRQVLPAVPHLLETVQVEGTFMDGTKLITVHDPISSDDGNLELALHGSFLPVPSLEKFSWVGLDDFPGEVRFSSGHIVLNLHRRALTLKVVNKADRPIQIGSHYHFIEANPYLVFDRQRAYGMRLNIPAGTAVRFEPGDAKMVTLVSIGGCKVIRGGNGIADGAVNRSQLNEIMEKIIANGFGHEDYPDSSEGIIGDGTHDYSVDHEKYASMYGPTTGDKIRLGDTDLFAEIEKDYAIYGDECIFGGGKVLRDGMGQSAGYPASDCLDTVVTNAVVIDYTGIYKADIGIKGGLIVAIGKAGNPDVMDMDGVNEDMIVGVNTEVIAAEGMIVTAGGIDCHVHFICPQLAEEAIASGITTLVGGGTGPAHGTCATTCTPAPSHMKLMLQSTDELPINMGFTGKGNTAKPDGLAEIIKAGAMGLKLHEDWGSTPAAIDNCLSVAEAFDIQVNIHTDTLNESGCVEHTIAAFKDRTIHTYHSEGAGGGHAPDIIKVCGVKNVLPSSTNPTRPFTSNTVDEHLDMLMVCHHLDRNIPEDVAFAESRIRAETIAAEDILHDMGAISIISSDSQAMGRIGEVITRTWQTANKMKSQRGRLPISSSSDAAEDNDNFRIKRYIAKYTINPAIVNGFSDFVGSVEVGKLADLVVWKPSFFGAKPEMVIKGGAIAWANMGDPNASIPTPEPVMMRPMFGAFGRAGSSNSIAFVSKIDRSWMYNIRRDSNEYRGGVSAFVSFTDNDRKNKMSKYMLCPCADCKNEKMFENSAWVHSHLIRRGFMEKYKCWSKHGEQKSSDVAADEVPEVENNRAVGDGIFVPSPSGGDAIHVDPQTLSDMLRDVEDPDYSERDFEKFSKLVADSGTPLYPGCKPKYNKLSSVLELMKLKASNGWSDKSFTDLLEFLKDLLLEGNQIPQTAYEAKQVLCPLGLEVKKNSCL